jgi:hypothetical protein
MVAPPTAGDGVFRIKGNVYVGILEFCDARVPGGRAAVLAQVSDVATSAFLKKPLLAASYYDCFPVLTLCEAAAKVAGMPVLAFHQAFSEAQAKRDISGVYKMMLKLATPEMVMHRVPKLATQIFDFVTTTVKELAPGHWLSDIRGVPEAMAPAFQTLSTAFIVAILGHAGAKGIEHRWLPPVVEGEKHGVKLMQLQRELKWLVKR